MPDNDSIEKMIANNSRRIEIVKLNLQKSLSKDVCKKHPVAAVIETLDKDYILGWNGVPSRFTDHDECARKDYISGEGMHLCPGIHAEERAIANAAKFGKRLYSSTLYMSEWFPCSNCAKSIIESGISRIVTPDKVYNNKETFELVERLKNQSYNFELSEKLFREANIDIIVNPLVRI
jgi:dCMP deaminase